MKFTPIILLTVAAVASAANTANLKFKAKKCSKEIEDCVKLTNEKTNKDGVNYDDIADAVDSLASCIIDKPDDCKVSAEGKLVVDTNPCHGVNYWDLEVPYLSPNFSPIGLTDIKFGSDLACLKDKKTYNAYNLVKTSPCEDPPESSAFELKVKNAKHVTYKLPKDFTDLTSGLPLRLPDCATGKATLTVRDKGAGARIAALAGIAALALL